MNVNLNMIMQIEKGFIKRLTVIFMKVIGFSEKKKVREFLLGKMEINMKEDGGMI